MKDQFIFVFLDDQTLDIVSPSDNLIGIYEGIDVEDGVYTFFDQDLRIMEPYFTKPNKRGRAIVESGIYKLVARQRKKEKFLNRLNGTSIVNSNEWFTTLDEIRDYATKIA